MTPGRTGSTTLFKAFSHSEVFSVGQQSNWGKIGKARLDYPDWHIESDARNFFFMGSLAALYNPLETHWIVMHRDLDQISHSYARRRGKTGILYNFGVGVIGMRDISSDFDWLQVSKIFVENSYAQISAFVGGRPNVHHINLANPVPSFRQLWEVLGAGAGLNSACQEWDVKHNSSLPKKVSLKTPFSLPRKWTR